MERKHVNLNQLVSDQLESFRQKVGGKVAVNFMSEEGLGVVDVDPVRVTRVLTALFANANSAMPNGGEIVILTRTVRKHPAMPRTESSSESDKYIMLSVTDNGSGTDNSTINRIFGNSSSTSEVKASFGSELAVVNGIVNECNGRMRVKRKAGEGTTFEIYLPSSQGSVRHPAKVIYRRARGSNPVSSWVRLVQPA